MPSEPVSIAAQSDSMSPNRLSVTMTSNCLGQRTSCMAQLSAYMWPSSTSLYSAACSAVTVWRHSTPVCMTLAFSTEVTLLRACGRGRRRRGDALDLRRGVDLGVEAALGAVRQGLDAARLAEIDAARQLAHDQMSRPCDDLRLQRGGAGERVEDHRRAQVGEEVHLLAQAQQAALGLLVERQVVPLGPPTEPNSTASASMASAMVSSVSGTPCLSSAAPPTRPSLRSKPTARRLANQSTTRRPGPSPRGRCRRRAGRESSCWQP
jgi:hypothetical protein